ncbi:MAG: FkbM family methyltransferase [Patescibacteria group bacterium]
MAIITQKINTRPQLTKHLVASGIFQLSPLTVIEVGARGGFEKHWDLYGEQIRLVGFEADIGECERLNRQNQDRNRKYFPIGLSHRQGKRTLYIQRHVASSSFYKSREDFLQRFPAAQDLIPHAAIEISTTDLDSFVAKNNLRPDFMKLDIEGAELDVFRGGTKCLGDSIFGLSTEAVFYPWRENIPTFSELDILLRKLGFVLFDLPIFRWEKKTLSPYMHEQNGTFGPTDKGQVVWTQALYLKDPVAELKQGLVNRWPVARILKLASIMELYNLEDCALELIDAASQLGLIKKRDRNVLMNLTTPPLNGRTVSYSEYVKYLKKVGAPRYLKGRKVSREEYEKYQSKK